VLIMGSLRLDEWLDAKTQQRRSKLKIVARDVQFLWSKEEVEAASAAVAGPETDAEDEAELEEEDEESEEAVGKKR